ncbi:MAG TPA: hypothetical protein VFN22_10880 [Gemmatimonadales bacterium]|nr:hypothetical protein [Gemmatimonadales bacterium]
MGSKSSKIIAMLMVITLLAMGIGFMIFLLDEVIRDGLEGVILGMAGLGGMSWVLFRGPVGKALANMLEGASSGADDPMLGMRVADIEDRLQEISLETQRMTELEDRLDFAERLLTRQSEGVRQGGE